MGWEAGPPFLQVIQYTKLVVEQVNLPFTSTSSPVDEHCTVFTSFPLISNWSHTGQFGFMHGLNPFLLSLIRVLLLAALVGSFALTVI
jgi:hypothetical protein